METLQPEVNDAGDLADVFRQAAHELGAYIVAVSDLFGQDQGRLAAEEWLEELESSNVSYGSTPDGWRSITIAAAVRLAARMNAHPMDTKVSPILSSNCSTGPSVA